MSHKQDKATTERNARTLRELLKKPENKTCADCKRNDPRWASWNLGVFLCIRCSGIHRSMGTHISKVKSVDLDVWTPEQMASIQNWGNKRANLYWEAHLRAGHVPPDHKMDSYIRSKYESKRWAREGPRPEDPSVLDTDAPPASATAPPQSPAPGQAPPTTHVSRPSIGARPPQGQTHQLFSESVVANRHAATSPVIAPPQQRQAAPPQQAQPPQQQGAALDLFSLDFHAPTSPAAPQSPEPKKDVTSEIMSLFSTAAPAPAQNAYGGGMYGAQPVQPQGQFGGMAAQGQAAWGAPAGGAWYGQAQQQPQQQAVPQQQSMMGNAGVGMWGANSGWNATPVAAGPAQPNIWGSPAAPAQQQQSLFSTSDVWGAPAASAAPAPTQKKDDVFGDIWGGFK